MSNDLNKSSKQKLSKTQLEEKRKLEREKRLKIENKKLRQERFKKVGIIIICLILIVALGIPTVAISLLAGGGVAAN